MQTFPTGSFANLKLGAEAEVGDREDVTQAYEALKKVVNDAFDAIHTTLLSTEYPSTPGYPIHVPETRTEEQVTRDQQIEGYYGIINITTTKKQLEMHWGNIEKLKDLELVTAYNNKLNSLT